MLQIQMRILRVFGLSKAEMNSIIENAQAEGSPSLRLQERDGEYLVCVQASAPTQAMADEYCEKWVQKLRTRFGDACYGFEDTTLAQAALDALLKKRETLRPWPVNEVELPPLPLRTLPPHRTLRARFERWEQVPEQALSLSLIHI